MKNELKLPLSKRSDKEIKYELEEVIIPQMYWYGLKDGMKDNEIISEINKILGKTMKEKINTIKSGQLDRDWS